MFLPEGGVAQWLEQRAHNLLVAGSNPATPTMNKYHNLLVSPIWLVHIVRSSFTKDGPLSVDRNMPLACSGFKSSHPHQK